MGLSVTEVVASSITVVAGEMVFVFMTFEFVVESTTIDSTQRAIAHMCFVCADADDPGRDYRHDPKFLSG